MEFHHATQVTARSRRGIGSRRCGLHALLGWVLLMVAVSSCAERPTTLDTLGPLVTAVELDSLLQIAPADIALIDVRPEEDFLQGHLPGAMHIWRPALAQDGLPHSSITASRAKLEAEFGKIGLRPEAHVVVYDGKMNADAANLWWVLRLAGHKAVTMLDGGYMGWQSQGFATENDAPAHSPTTFKFSQPADSSHYASLEMVRAALHDPKTLLLDTRSLDEFTGRTLKEGALRRGHIPGSIWLDYAAATEEKNGCVVLKSPAALQAMFAAKGVTPDKNIICYCHSGVRSAHTTFVLTALLGFPSVRNYDGSWQEWSQDHALSIATGADSITTIIN
jgi:thiosulfate/3-mercaptopyruvate sulfurtransferase